MTHLEQAFMWWHRAEIRGDEGPVPNRHARLLLTHACIELEEEPNGYELTSKGRAAIIKLTGTQPSQRDWDKLKAELKTKKMSNQPKEKWSKEWTAEQKLKCFLYVLGRDYLSLGKIQAIMNGHVNSTSYAMPAKFTNPELEAYAQRITADLLGEE